jgi:hypothetical protein
MLHHRRDLRSRSGPGGKRPVPVGLLLSGGLHTHTALSTQPVHRAYPNQMKLRL